MWEAFYDVQQRSRHFFPSSERKKRKNCVSDFALPDDSTTDFFPLCYSHHTHTIRSHYVIRAEILRPRPMILWRDCALFACDCINDTCKKKKKKTLASRSRTFLLPGRCVSNIVTGMVADLYFTSYTKKKKEIIRKDRMSSLSCLSRGEARLSASFSSFPLFLLIIPEIGVVTSERRAFPLSFIRIASDKWPLDARTKWKCVETKRKIKRKEAAGFGWRGRDVLLRDNA